MPVSSSAYVRVANAQSIFENLIAHALEPEAPVDRTNASNASIAIGRNSINLSAPVSELRLTVAAESESLMYFLKESAAKHLAELDELLAARLTWQETTAETPQQVTRRACRAGAWQEWRRRAHTVDLWHAEQVR